MNWQEIVKSIAKHSDRVKKVTQPLHDHFGVEYFTYHRVDGESNYTVLLDRPDWAEHYVEEKYYLLDPYMRHPDVYKNGLTLIENHGTEEYRAKILDNAQKKFQLDLGVILIEKGENCVEFFGFSGNRNRCSLPSLYLNNSHRLKSFATHFKKELNDILLPMQEEKRLLKELKGEDFYCPDPIQPDIAPADLLAYLTAIGKGVEVAQWKKLSSRERECLKLLINGLSAKETARALNLSPRTIESYFEQVKNKLDCFTKAELFSLAKHFHQLGLLP